ncbi:MAG: nicotinate-nucleotide adenylyltransferase [Cyanobium sp.]
MSGSLPASSSPASDPGSGAARRAAKPSRAGTEVWSRSEATRSAAGEPAGSSGAAPREPIALFGSSADPPTHGHRALLQGLLRYYPQVATWASDNPLKQHTAPLPLRMALLQALVEAIGDPRLQLVQELSSPWTVETLERARQLWPGREPVIVIGADLAAQVPRWRQAAQWLQGCRVAIVPRAGWTLQPHSLEQLRQRGARLELLDLVVPASASSGVRQRPDPQLVPQELWPVLRGHDPYGLLTPRCASPSPSSTP